MGRANNLSGEEYARVIESLEAYQAQALFLFMPAGFITLETSN